MRTRGDQARAFHKLYGGHCKHIGAVNARSFAIQLWLWICLCSQWANQLLLTTL